MGGEEEREEGREGCGGGVVCAADGDGGGIGEFDGVAGEEGELVVGG